MILDFDKKINRFYVQELGWIYSKRESGRLGAGSSSKHKVWIVGEIIPINKFGETMFLKQNNTYYNIDKIIAIEYE